LHSTSRRKFFLSSGAILLAVSWPGSVGTTEKKEEWEISANQPMTARIVRSAAPGCEPKCPEWISAEGRIDVLSGLTLQRVVASIHPKKLPILVNSMGGLLQVAIGMGKFIRKRDLDVVVARTVFEPCGRGPHDCDRDAWKGHFGRPDWQSGICSSACTLILAGGVRRFVPPGAKIALHGGVLDPRIVEHWRHAYHAKNKEWPSEEYTQRQVGSFVAALVEPYFAKMGISREISVLTLSTPATDLRFLTKAELVDWRLATHLEDGRRLLDQASK
jgi:hypothetical protein